MAFKLKKKTIVLANIPWQLTEAIPNERHEYALSNKLWLQSVILDSSPVHWSLALTKYVAMVKDRYSFRVTAPVEKKKDMYNCGNILAIKVHSLLRSSERIVDTNPALAWQWGHTSFKGPIAFYILYEKLLTRRIPSPSWWPFPSANFTVSNLIWHFQCQHFQYFNATCNQHVPREHRAAKVGSSMHLAYSYIVAFCLVSFPGHWLLPFCIRLGWI